MNEDTKKMFREELDNFSDSMMKEMEKEEKDYLLMWNEYELMHLENALRDIVVAYMGDKESERSGKPEDFSAMGAHCFLLWLKKKNEHLI